MTVLQSRRYCRDCGRKTLHETRRFSGAVGLILTVITIGAFLPIWFLIFFFEMFQPWRCSACGEARLY